jgi:mannose-6-phosphate isomerase-like protein (cupin superfamily)
MTQEKPWGTVDEWIVGERFVMGKFLLREGQRTSLHLHEGQSHFWFVESGNGELVVEESVFLIGPSDSIYIDVGQLHRASAMVGDMEVFFVTAGLIDGGDIVRFEDDYGRAHEGLD